MLSNMSKRLLSFVLALFIAVSLVPLQAFASESEPAADDELAGLMEAVTEAAEAVSESETEESTEVETPAEDGPAIEDYETFVMFLSFLEEIAQLYVRENPGNDPLELIIKYIRTGVDRYNSGSWGIMAGYEDPKFAAYVTAVEDMLNAEIPEGEPKYYISSLKNIENFYIPNGDYVDFGHMFGTMDITYHNKTSANHADVAGWTGDIVDLLSTTDRHGVSGTLEEMVADISENYLCKSFKGESDQFTQEDMYGDLDAYYIMQQLYAQEYEMGTLTAIITEYFTEELNDETRAAYLLENRLNGVSTRGAIRDAVYTAYTGNKVVTTLEATREFNNTDLTDLRKACCYAFADYLCRLAGDYVDVTENPYYTVFSSEYTTLAPGITQEIKLATTADNKQIAYYIATADMTRDDVDVHANYNEHDPSQGWAMQRVEDQANAAQAYHSDPESENYIENFNVIAAVNGAGFNMSTGEPSGLLVMHGKQYQGVDGNGFIGVLKDGTPVIGTANEYKTIYKDQVRDGIAIFGTTLVKDGEICITRTDNYYSDRASRTAAGITKTGKFVFMVLDGRQEPFSCGGSMLEIAQIMQEAGCVHAVNLDGGGSTTYVAKQPGDEALSVVSSPSDGFARSVSTSLFMVSTAPSSTAFDHAILESETDYLTVGTSIQLTPAGVSATGNAAELPEGYTWAVSDTRWGTITEDGVFTALRNGDVQVYLMLGDETIGTKTLHVVIPNNVYYTRDNMDAVYGTTITLPAKALYDNKEVAVSDSDLVFTLSNANAGVMDGYDFTAKEGSGLKNVTITVALAADSSITDTITVALYNEGEATFNFDKATGGDRQFAWDRQVSNTTTEDAITYQIVDTNEDMVTSYTFAIDMTQIPIPERLADLTAMLPGADVEGASAWTFLLQLAERISPLSEVTPVIRFDSNMEVDYSNLTLVNEYFHLEGYSFNEETNELTLNLRWIDQTQAIDPETANPLCIVSGIKLTPKADAQWDSKSRLSVVNTGEIGYTIYMRAGALHSFAQKPENQEIYGLYPYVNPDDSADAGGYFGDIYGTFHDTYTLVNALQNGWVNVDGGFAYYVDGTALTGIQQADGLYYDFGANGVNVGKTPYTGLLEKDGALYYVQFGKLASGWVTVNGAYYHFNMTTYQAHTGESKVGLYTYLFDETGKLIRGAFVETSKGLRYYWAGALVARAWIELEEGTLYVNDDGYVVYGNFPVLENATEDPVWMHFDEETGYLTGNCDGFIQFQGAEYYCEDGIWYYGAIRVDDGIIFCGSNGRVVKNGKCYISASVEVTAGLENGYYWCGADGRILANGFATIDGYDYYFADYVRAKGLTKIGDDFYYFNASSGKMNKGVTLWVSGNNAYGLVSGYYDFQADGTMYVPDPNGEKAIVEENGKLYFTINGVKQKNGLYELDGEYYYAQSNSTLARGTTIWVSIFNDLIAPGSGYFAFDEDGKMIKTGFVTGGGATYYYDDLVRVKGFTKIGESYYFFNAGSGKMSCGVTLWVSGNNAYGIASGYYDFQADGTMYIPDPNGEKAVVEENGSLYFTIDGMKQKNGLNELDGEYYYATTNGTLARNTTIWISSFNDLMAPGGGYFAFDAEGKLVKTGFATGGGATYYYDDLVRVKGFTKIGESYYFFNAGSGKMSCNVTLWVGSSNPYGVAAGYYMFQADGTMYVPDPNGERAVIEENGNLYFTIDGVRQTNGLNELDGEYYYAKSNGTLVRNATIWISSFNDLIAPGGGYFAFDENGKLIKTGFVTGGGYTYYYDDLVRVKGFTKIGESYYFFNAGSGKMSCGVTLWVGSSNPYGVKAGSYYFGTDGKMA